jgi:membrane protease YdiL (CAAX protease family)
MLSVKPWKVDAVALLLLGIFGCISSILLLLGLVQHFTGGKLAENSPWTMVLGTLALDAPILLMVCLFLILERITWAEAFGFNSPGRGRALRLGVLVGLAFLPIGLGLKVCSEMVLNEFQILPHDQQPVQILTEAGPGLVRAGLAFFAIGVAPVAEETLFRGVLYPTIKQCGFPRTALWGTSFAFALVHVNLPTFVPLLVLALALAWLYEKTDNLLACIAAHVTFNAANVALLYLSEFFPGHAT